MVSIANAALRKDVSKATVYAAIARKVLLRHYARGNLVVDERELAAWIPGQHRGGYPKGRKQNDVTRTKIGLGQKRRWAERKRNSV